METAATLQRGAFPLFAYLNVASRAAGTMKKPLFQAFPATFAHGNTGKHCIKDGMKIDPTCGSGGFLIKAFEYVREKIEADVRSQKYGLNSDGLYCRYIADKEDRRL